MSNPSKKTDNKNSAKKQLDLYSYTGKVKFFDKDKGFGYIQEIPDTKNLKNVVKEWRITAEQLGNTIIHRGDFVYYCGHQFEFATDSAKVTDDRDKDPAFNCLAGTDEDVACPTCGKHAWKKYGYHQNIRCRCCGSDHPTKNKLELNAFGKLFFTLLFFPLVIPFFLLFKVGKNAHNKL